jgi:hypothetical protein
MVTIAVMAVASFSFDASSSKAPCQPPVIGGKKAISLAPAIAVSGLTWVRSIAAHARLLERIGITLAARRQPADQVGYGTNARGRLDRLLGLADPFAHPGEILHLHSSSSLMR